MARASCNVELIKNMIIRIIDQNKGYDITTLDVEDKTIIAKYMIIASGNSTRHVKALAEHIISSIKQHDKEAYIEGMSEGNWIIVNVNYIMVHIFRPEVRKYYKIEELWN